jgi:YYY domain-containing protein
MTVEKQNVPLATTTAESVTSEKPQVATVEAEAATHGRDIPWKTSAVLRVALPLILILFVAAYFRFNGLDWDGNFHLHPDERFLTMVGTSLESVSDPRLYFRTSESPLNPYNRGYGFFVYGNFPMTVTRYVAEGVTYLCDTVLAPADGCAYRYTAYDGIHLVGRVLSGLMDLVSIFFIFLIGARLYDRRAGLLAALLQALAVMPIQQAHFFTMDNWAAGLTTMAMYTAVRAAERGAAKRWWLLFGLALGLTAASRINMAPLAAMAGVAAIVWLARRAAAAPAAEQTAEAWRYLLTRQGWLDWQRVVLGVMLAAVVSLLVFRVAQPYAFADSQIVRQESLMKTGHEPGALSLLLRSTVGFNPQWLRNMAEIQAQQKPDAMFPPAVQWTDRAPILFPLTNMVLYGMGVTAALLAWFGFFWALWRIAQGRPEWTSHALPVAWVGLYFLFMGTRWVSSIRYFLPIYPFLFLLAGWALVELWRWASRKGVAGYQVDGGQEGHKVGGGLGWRHGAVLLLALLVVLPSLLWAHAFSRIYRQPVTRVAASIWMYENVPSGASLIYDVEGAAGTEQREHHLPLRGYEFIPAGPPLNLSFRMPEDGVATAVRFNYLSNPYGIRDLATLHLHLNPDTPRSVEAEHSFQVDGNRQAVTITLPPVRLASGEPVQLVAETGPGIALSAGTSRIASEHWDDILPVMLDGRIPYTAYYAGVTDNQLPVTHLDSEGKREEVLTWLDEADYIVLSSQRAVWSLPRIPLSYPLMIRYYEALFSGELGFKLAHQEHADLRIGPLHISDTAGRARWGKPPLVGWPPPGDLAAEEAFSVYDHPPVWIFAKTDVYSPERARQVLDAVDLDHVMFMTPGQASQAPNGLMLPEAQAILQRAGGTFSQIFAVDGLLSRHSWLAALVWWLAVIVLGWLAFPIAFVVFRSFADRGYALARILALLLISYFAWLMASLNLLPHNRATLALGLLLMAALSLAILLRRRHEVVAFVHRQWPLLGAIEFIGVALYLLFILIRLGNPDVWDVIWGGEKPMDLSYFTAVMKSTTFPPYDPWFAGGYINYYYYGFVYVGSITLLLGIVPTVAYNLILPMLASFTGLAAFCIAYNLVASGEYASESELAKSQSRKLINSHALLAGTVATVFSVLLGNLAQVGVLTDAWYRAGEPVLNSGIAVVDGLAQTLNGAYQVIVGGRTPPIYPGDWFWTATRAINHRPGEAGPITEFPFFTFLYGDLHAHMIALPLTLLALGWAVALALRNPAALKLDAGDQAVAGRLKRWETGLEMVLLFVVGALSIGVLRPTNTWDWPTYLFVGILAVLFYNYRRHGRISLPMLGQAGLQAVALAAISSLAFWPFARHYGAGYTSLSLWQGSYTHLSNYLVIHGLFLFFVVTHVAREFRAWSNTWRQNDLERMEPFGYWLLGGLFGFVVLIALLAWRGYWIAPVAVTLIVAAGLLGLRPGLPPARRIVLILIASALGLTLFVEIFVLEGDVGRMNTVFKFYLQVWLMLSVAVGAAAAWVWPAVRYEWGPTRRRTWQVVLALLLLAAVLYPLLATRAKWQIRMSPDAPTTLDGMAFMAVTEYYDTAYDGSGVVVPLRHDYEAIQWLQRHVAGSPIIVEAYSHPHPGFSPYRTITSRVSMYTGLPAVVGWDWHQRQQRAVLPGHLVSRRVADVNLFYNTPDLREALVILDRYNIEYIYAGTLEWTYYHPEGLLKFDQLVELGHLREVYRNAGVSVYEVVRGE